VPTVPRIQGKQVFAEPISAAKQTVSADETTFGGGAPNKSVVAATEQLNNTVQKNIEAQNKINEVISGNRDADRDLKKFADMHYSTKDIEIDYEEDDGTISKVTVKEGLLNRPKKYSKYAAKYSTDGMNAIIAEGIKGKSAEAAERYLHRMSSSFVSYSDRASVHEIAERKSYIKEEGQATIAKIGSDPSLDLQQKKEQISQAAYQLADLSGESRSVADVEIQKAVDDAYLNDLSKIQSERVPTKKEYDALRKMGEKNNVSGDALYKGEKKLEESLASAKLKAEETIVTAETENMTKPIQDITPMTIDWGLNPLHLWKKSDKKKYTELDTSKSDEYAKQITAIDEDKAAIMLASTEAKTLNEIRLKMVDPTYRDDKKRLDHITALREKKLGQNDYLESGELYNLSQDDKQFASQGLRGIDKYVSSYVEGNSEDVRRMMGDSFLRAMKESKPEDKKSFDAFMNSKVIFPYMRLKYPKLTGVKDEHMPMSVVALNGGKEFAYQSSGVNTPSKAKPDVSLSSTKQPASQFSGHPKYEEAVAYLRQNKKSVSDKNIKLVLENA